MTERADEQRAAGGDEVSVSAAGATGEGEPTAETPSETATPAPEAERPPEAPRTDEASDPWAPFDVVLQAFVADRRAGAGSFWVDDPTAPVGRFATWNNAAGWPCVIRLVREPTEHAVVVVAEGPPLPGGRPRQLPLTAIPAPFEPETLRMALEIGYLVGETWGPREEPAPPPPEPGSAAAAPTAEP